MPKQRKGKKAPQRAPYDVAQSQKNKASSTKAKKDTNPLFVARPKVYAIGSRSGQQPKRDLTHFVHWPKNVRVQRQKRVLHDRLKVPPAVNQFSLTVEKNEAKRVFSLLDKYRPETKKEKKARLIGFAKQKADNPDWTEPKPPHVVKFGINHVTTLVEQKKAKLVLIAHDVDPLEIVIWLPALCRKMGVPYAIVKGKARLGRVVHQKNATCVALVDVNKEDAGDFAKLTQLFKEKFNEQSVERQKQWGGQRLGHKARAKAVKKAASTGR